MTAFITMPKSPLRDALHQCSQLASDYDALLEEAQEFVLFNSTALWVPDHMKKHEEIEMRLRAKGEAFEKSLRQYQQVKGDKR